mmetsp:Transcript_2416/g.8135  ORF Transcript_2416/g.8135 Transcript_2416/m.8135 type:complete len:394 (-) Transcript_2416:1024-2205(-)
MVTGGGRGLLLLLLELPLLRTVLLPLVGCHLRHALLFLLCLSLPPLCWRVVVQPQVAPQGSPSALGVERVSIDLIFELQHVEVGPQGHLPQAVAVEVELVLVHIIEVLQDVTVLVKGPAHTLKISIRLFGQPQVRRPELVLVPDALHLVQVLQALERIRLLLLLLLVVLGIPGKVILGEEHRERVRLVDIPGAELVLDRVAVEVPVREVELPGMVRKKSSTAQVSRVLHHLGLNGVELDHCGGVGDGSVALFQRLGDISNPVVVLREEGQHPDEDVGRHLLRGVPFAEGSAFPEARFVALEEPLDQLGIPALLVEVLERLEERRDPLLEPRPGIGVHSGDESPTLPVVLAVVQVDHPADEGDAFGVFVSQRVVLGGHLLSGILWKLRGGRAFH